MWETVNIMDPLSWLILSICVFEIGNAKEPAAQWRKQAQSEIQDALQRRPNTNVAKNVILFVGDGMGVSTVTAMRIKKGQDQGQAGEENVLSFEKFPHVALSKTYTTDYQVADSAGTATAFLCGVKTKSFVVGVDDEVKYQDCSTRKKSEIDCIHKWSQNAGKSTGIVTTTSITHATPAAAYASSPSRMWETDADIPSQARGHCKDIGVQLIERGKDIQVLLGGGRAHLLPHDATDPEYPNVNGTRRDGRRLIDEWIEGKKNKFAYVWNKTELLKVNPKNTDYLLGLFEPGHMQYSVDRNETTEPSLVEMTEKAIKILQKNKNGFFLLVEGGRIDHGHHDGVALRALTEGVEFADTVERVMQMVDTKDTLVVVTADHSHMFNIGSYPMRGNPILALANPAWPMIALDKLPYTTLVYGNGPGYKIINGTRQNLTDVNTSDKNYQQQSAFPLAAETHAGEDVAIYATGPMAHLFSGVKEQSYIAHVMAYASCVGENQDHCINNAAPIIGISKNLCLFFFMSITFMFLKFPAMYIH